MEVIIIPFFELIIVFVEVSNNKDILNQSASIDYYILVVTKAAVRAYFAYLIYSFYMRVDRGEQLLVEYGGRKLNKMIDEIKEEQRK